MPQRLDKILAALHYLILFDDQVRDYHFTVHPTDHHHILNNGFPKLTKLEKLLGHTLKIVRLPRARTYQLFLDPFETLDS
jgi:hypothetical protein